MNLGVLVLSRKSFHFLRYVGLLGHILVVVKIKEKTDQSCFSLADLLDEILTLGNLNCLEKVRNIGVWVR